MIYYYNNKIGGRKLEKKLYKSANNRVLCGVCGGIGEYFDLDPVIVRLLVVVFTLMGGAGLIGYIIAAIIVPEKKKNKDVEPNYTYDDQSTYSEEYEPVEKRNTSNGRGILTFGIILIFLGAFVLLKGFIPWIPREIALAALLIGLGIYFVIKRSNN